MTEHFSNESDADVLVEFELDYIPGMIRLCAMERELSEIVGRKADMCTPNDSNHFFRKEVLSRAVVQYAA